MVMRPDKFTEQAQEAISNSQQIVRTMRRTQWDVEHVLLALLEQQNGVPGEVLKKLNVDLQAMASELRRTLDRAPKATQDVVQVCMTPRVQMLLENADREAQRLKDFPKPVLIVWGEQDNAIPVSHARLGKTALPSAQVVIFPDCGHWSQLERADEFNAVMLRFLAEAGPLREGV